MKTNDLPSAIEALGYDKESINIKKHLKYHHNVMRDTFLRIQLDNTEGVGSMYEGLATTSYRTNKSIENDKDLVRYLTEIKITTDDGTQSISETINVANDLKIIPCTKFPGYVKLKPLKFIFGCDFIPNNVYDNGIERRQPIAETVCLKYEINGPALTTKHMTVRGTTKRDYVFCFLYKSWPPEASKWESRNKSNNFPSKELIDKIKLKGFTLAPVGHYDSSEADKKHQWRIGIQGENELLSNLNETQMLCFVALKLILKGEKQHISDDALSSFHMKSVIFWCAEQESCQWIKENFEICLKTCIKRLIHFLTSGYFPHYFIEDRNLINAKMTLKVKERIVATLSKYSSDTSIMLSLNAFDQLRKLPYFTTDLLECAKQRSIIETCIYFNIAPYMDLFYEPNYMWQTYFGHNTAINLQNAQNILTILKNEKRNFIRPHIAYAKNMLGLLSYSRYNETRSQNDYMKAKSLLRSSFKFENVSLKFRVATFYFMENKFDICLCVCHDFLRNPAKCKSLHEKAIHVESVFTDIRTLIDIRKNAAKLSKINNVESVVSELRGLTHFRNDVTQLAEIKEKLVSVFNDKHISEECGDGRYLEAEAILSEIRNLYKPKGDYAIHNESNMSKIVIQYLNRTSLDALLLVVENCANLVFRDMSFNVPYLASEKWAVPDVIKYELLSVQRFQPESCVYGIYIDPMLNCLVLTFLCYQKTKNWTQMNETLTKMNTYIKEYPRLTDSRQRVPAELPHSLPLYRVYNIVAYCCVKAGLYRQAIYYLLNSLKQYQMRQNAAYGYIRCVCGILNSFS